MVGCLLLCFIFFLLLMFGFSFLQVGGFEKFSRASCLLGCVRHLVFLFSIRPESTVSTINGLSHKNREK